MREIVSIKIIGNVALDLHVLDTRIEALVLVAVGETATSTMLVVVIENVTDAPEG